MDRAEVTALEWFAGYGGNSLGLARVLPGLRVVAACEIEGYAVANLVAKAEGGWLDAFPVWSDCRSFPLEPFRGLIDLFIASYPCQGFSAAGKRGGQGDPRFLWPYVLRAIVVIQPRRVFLENVEGHVSLGLREVLADLAAIGYRVESRGGEPTWGLFSAEECGAPHRRKRVFILGERCDVADAADRRERERLRIEKASGAGRKSRAEGHGKGLADADLNGRYQRRKRKPEAGNDGAVGNGERGELADAASERGRRGLCQSGSKHDGNGVACHCGDVADACVSRLPITECGELPGAERDEEGRATQQLRRASLPHFPPGPGDFDAWREVLAIDPTLEPALCGVADGRASRVDELRLAGNGVCPDTAALAWLILDARMRA